MFSVVEPIVDGAGWFVEKPALTKSLDWQYGILGLMCLLAVATLVGAAMTSRRRGDSGAIWICVGAALATFYEPLGDLFAHVTYHEQGQLNFTTAFGFRTPLWVLPTYVLFFGATTVWLQSQIERGMTLRRWILLFIATLPGAWLFEVPLLRMGAIEYYGANQPIQVFGYPLWMAFVNSTTMFVVATACHWLARTSVMQRHPILFAPIFPMLIVGANGGAALPLGSALNASASPWVTNAAAGVSIALSLLYVWICGNLLADYSDKRVHANHEPPECAHRT
ncbi:MAG TPA: hypothetical protein VJM31_19035 [Vicinamibacterales bacterium]|nr:hypothetical protein [Vicinamibacterales bacterium]